MSHKKPVRIDPQTEALPAGGCDSHAHLNMPDFDEDRNAVLSRAQKCGVSHIGNVFLGPSEYQNGKKLFETQPEVFFLLGIHPHDASQFDEACAESIEKAFRQDTRLKAVGEIGLDYYFDHSPRDLQRQVFAMQMHLARKLDKPCVIHCRDAEDDCLAFLEAGGFKNYPLLWHCFGGTPDLASRIIKNGWHISVPGSVTYPKNSASRDALNVIPQERLLLETDCPYLPPVPWRGTRNEPAYLVFTARAVASALALPPEQIWDQTGKNAVRFFGLS